VSEPTNSAVLPAEEPPERPIDVPLGTTSGSAGRALLLATLTGIVDAGVFLKTGILPSVMTANTIFIGLWLVLGHWNTLFLAVAAVVTFGGASMIAVRVVRSSVDTTQDVQRLLERLEFSTLLVLAGLGVIERLGLHLWPDPVNTLLVVVVATAAMAMQMPQVRKVEDVGVSTLFTTGAIAALAYDLADGRHGPKVLRHERLYMGLIGAYAVGGAVGGALALLTPGLGLIVPVIVFSAASLWHRLRVNPAK